MSPLRKAAVTVLFGLAAVLSFRPASGQVLPDKKVVQEWVSKARNSGGLQSPDDQPYHLVAKLRYTLADKTIEAMYEILWAAPDRYRVEFRGGESGETDLVLGDKKYVERNTPTMTFAMWSISRLLVPPRNSSPAIVRPSDSVRKLRSVSDGPTRQICAEVGDNLAIVEEMCFDAVTTDLAAAHIHPKSSNSVVGGAVTMDLTDYKSLGKMRFPQHLVRHSGPESIDATIERWEAVQTFGENMFVPSPNSRAWDWCSAPTNEWPKGSNGPSVPFLKVDSVTGTVSLPYFGFYKVVEPDGTVKQATQLFGSADGPAKPIIDRALYERSAVRRCGGKPVEYETIVTFWPAFVAAR